MMTKEEAEKWIQDITDLEGAYEYGAYSCMREYMKRHEVGKLAEDFINKLDPVFLYGIEYGIIIAIDKIFKDEV